MSRTAPDTQERHAIRAESDAAQNQQNTVAITAPKWIWPTLLVLLGGAGVAGWAHSFTSLPPQPPVFDVPAAVQLAEKLGKIDARLSGIESDIGWIKKVVQRGRE